MAILERLEAKQKKVNRQQIRNAILIEQIVASLPSASGPSNDQVYPQGSRHGVGDHEHEEGRTALKLSTDFVLHSLRHTMLTRLGECGAMFSRSCGLQATAA